MAEVEKAIELKQLCAVYEVLRRRESGMGMCHSRKADPPCSLTMNWSTVAEEAKSRPSAPVYVTADPGIAITT